jgi:hypothetical protein
MDKKVTRRVALGTVAVGLGSAVAAPYIISALKGSYKANSPVGGRYEKEWESVVKMLSIPIQETSGPETFTLDYMPQTGTEFRMIAINASYGVRPNPEEYPAAPLSFETTAGKVALISAIEDSKPTLSIKADNTITKAKYLTRPEEQTGGECIAVLKDDSIDGMNLFKMIRGAPKKLSLSEVNYGCLMIARGLKCNYPMGKALAKGVKWIIPETSDNCVELPCKIVGFAKVAGRDTAKIQAERQLTNSQDIERYLTLLMKRNIELEKAQNSNFDVEAFMKRNIKQAIKDEWTQSFLIIAYIDLQTGIPIRQQSKTVTYLHKGKKKDTSGISITQLLES